jgi:hypothetical protein
MARTLALSTQGEDVRLMQKAFNLLDLGGINPDAIFGEHTRIRVLDYQHTRSLRLGTPDGRYGPATRQQLAEDLRDPAFCHPLLLAHLRRHTTLEAFAQAVADGRSCAGDVKNPFDYRFK